MAPRDRRADPRLPHARALKPAGDLGASASTRAIVRRAAGERRAVLADWFGAPTVLVAVGVVSCLIVILMAVRSPVLRQL